MMGEIEIILKLLEKLTNRICKCVDNMYDKEITEYELKLLENGFSMSQISVTREEVHER